MDEEKTKIEIKVEEKPSPESKSGKKKVGIIVFCLGMVTSVAGLTFFLVNLFTEPGLRDAEYLVEIGTWTRKDQPSVIWQFTEVGKGTLTTNAHTNDYDFIWAISGNKLEVETEWLHNLEDEFSYVLSQDEPELILNESIVFVPAN